MKRTTMVSLRVAPILGHVGAGQHAERRAEQHREHGEDQAADDRVQQPAGAARRRRHLGEDREREPAHALHDQHQQDEHEPGQAESGARRSRAQSPDDPASVFGDSAESLLRLPSYFPSFCAIRISMSLAAASTTKVMKNRMRPRAMSEAV